MKPTFFKTPVELRKWLEKHHDQKQELLVGFYKKATGKPSVTWPEVVDECLCFGWIDGIRRSLDDESYTIRITPRRPRSIWSAVNIKRVEELTKQSRMTPTGLAAFEKRTENRSGIYSHEQRPEVFEPASEKPFKANKKAWAFFEAAPRSYRRAAIWWVISAKKDETKTKRLAELIKLSAEGKTIPQFTRIIKTK
jgi:uncharacterized protein YdeI (YjbR/CyaY-like superfamily)